MLQASEPTPIEIRRALYLGRKPVFKSDHKGSGFYAIFLKSDHTIPNLDLPEDGLLYIGMTTAGFSRRDHIFRTHSGGCTLRRSIGALMRLKLNLRVEAYQTKTNKRSFKFDKASEEHLSTWMAGAINQTRVPYSGHVGTVERRLISLFEPPLNLRGWSNPQSSKLRGLRYACWRETRVHREERSVA